MGFNTKYKSEKKITIFEKAPWLNWKTLDVMKRTLAIVFLICSVHCVYSQNGHGYIFFDTVVIYTPEYEAFENKRIELFRPYLDTINLLEKELSNHYYQISQTSDSTVIESWDIKRMEYEKNIDKYAEFVNSLSEQYFHDYEPFFKTWVQKYLVEFCQKNNCNSKEIILEEKQCTDCKDYTEEFILFLKEEYF